MSYQRRQSVRRLDRTGQANRTSRFLGSLGIRLLSKNLGRLRRQPATWTSRQAAPLPLTRGRTNQSPWRRAKTRPRSPRTIDIRVDKTRHWHVSMGVQCRRRGYTPSTLLPPQSRHVPPVLHRQNTCSPGGGFPCSPPGGALRHDACDHLRRPLGCSSAEGRYRTPAPA